MEQIVRDHVIRIWDYMHLNHRLENADCIVGFGCYDEDIPVRCAELYRQGYAPVVVFSGGLGRNTTGLFTETEAERFARIAETHGVPRERIVLEDRSSNSAENLLFTPRVLEQQGITAKKIIAVHKPYMERRLLAAMGVYWPGVSAVITSPRVTLEEHLAHAASVGMSEKRVLDTIVGDLQRMRVYAQKGYQIPQEIPEEVWGAFVNLCQMGYTGQLVK